MERARTTRDRGCVEVNGRALVVRGALRREGRSGRTAVPGSYGDLRSRPSLRAEAHIAWIHHPPGRSARPKPATLRGEAPVAWIPTPACGSGQPKRASLRGEAPVAWFLRVARISGLLSEAPLH